MSTVPDTRCQECCGARMRREASLARSELAQGLKTRRLRRPAARGALAHKNVRSCARASGIRRRRLRAKARRPSAA